MREASELFSDDLLEDVAIECVDRRRPIFVAQRSQLAELLDAQARKLFLPAIERLLADPEPATDFGDLLGPFRRPQIVSDSRLPCGGFHVLGQAHFHPSCISVLSITPG